jgi:hypothetical protein
MRFGKKAATSAKKIRGRKNPGDGMTLEMTELEAF